jgi:protein TonB
MAGERSRRSAALAMSAALHAAILALLVGRGAVQLAVEHRAVTIDLVEAASRTAGPGILAEELRRAAAFVTPPSPALPREEAPVPQPPPTKTSTVRHAKALPAREVAPSSSPSAPEAAAPPPGAAAVAGAPGGKDAVSSAPAWAPTARVRYEELLYAWMEKHKQYPMLARRRGLEGAGAVRVRIARDGHLLENAIVRSTGDAMLDQAALDMVRRANPFPGVPAEYDGQSFEFVAPIEYRLR